MRISQVAPRPTLALLLALASVSLTLVAASREERYAGTRIAELEAKVAICYILDELELTESQMKCLVECRQRFAPLAERCHNELVKWVETTEPWKHYAKVGLKGDWPTGRMLGEVQRQDGVMKRVMRPIHDEINTISETFAAELSSDQRDRLKKLSKENFIGKKHLLSWWAPDDLENHDLSEETRYHLRTKQVKRGMPNREAQIVMAPFLEDALEERIRGGTNAMKYKPQSASKEEARFPPYWDYSLWREHIDRLRWFSTLTLITGLNPQPEQSVALVKVLDQHLDDTGRTVTPYDMDYSEGAGKTYCRALERAVKKALRGNAVDSDDMRQLGRTARTFWRHREKGKATRDEAVARIQEQLEEILTAGQREYIVQLHLCPVPFESNISTSRAGQVASDFAAAATRNLDQMRDSQNWDGNRNQQTRLMWLKRLSPGYDRLNDRQKADAYQTMMNIVERARRMNDGEYLAKRNALAEELLWLNDLRTADLLRQTQAAEDFDRVLNERLSQWFVTPQMKDVLEKRVKAMARDVAQNE